MRIYVKVVPGSSQEKVEKDDGGNFKVWVSAPPEKGKANERLLDVLAEHFGVAKKEVRIVSGRTSRIKLIELRI
jgi:uncharacterized protein